MKKILILNGPNLNLIGQREPEIYGTRPYSELVDYIEAECAAIDVDSVILQSNHEGELIDYIQAAQDGYIGIVLNPAGYTHTSVAIFDAVRSVAVPTVEVHLSDLNAREEFRKISYVRPACVATIMGHGFEGYMEAVHLLLELDAKNAPED